MKRPLHLLFGTTLLICAMDAGATLSTLIWQPAVDIQPFLNPHFGWDSYISLKQPFVTTLNGGITMGVLPFKRIQMEVGIDYRDLNGNHIFPWYANAKLGSPEGSFFKYQPAIVAGVYDLGFNWNQHDSPTNYDIIFGQLGETLWKLGRFTVGGFYGNPKLLVKASSLDASGTPKRDNVGVLLGWDRVLSELTGKLWLCAEYQGTYSGYGALSFGFSWSFSPNVSVIYGVDFFNDSKTYAPAGTVQLDINLF
ncbi:MAG TPA: hypothetical protein VLX68_09855 [Chitinivibrionales bacterium]|nr:hypothetical protein [Chitinivibrionales bacterium]